METEISQETCEKKERENERVCVCVRERETYVIVDSIFHHQFVFVDSTFGIILKCWPKLERFARRSKCTENYDLCFKYSSTINLGCTIVTCYDLRVRSTTDKCSNTPMGISFAIITKSVKPYFQIVPWVYFHSDVCILWMPRYFSFSYQSYWRQKFQISISDDSYYYCFKNIQNFFEKSRRSYPGQIRLHQRSMHYYSCHFYILVVMSRKIFPQKIPRSLYLDYSTWTNVVARASCIGRAPRLSWFSLEDRWKVTSTTSLMAKHSSASTFTLLLPFFSSQSRRHCEQILGTRSRALLADARSFSIALFSLLVSSETHRAVQSWLETQRTGVIMIPRQSVDWIDEWRSHVVSLKRFVLHTRYLPPSIRHLSSMFHSVLCTDDFWNVTLTITRKEESWNHWRKLFTSMDVYTLFVDTSSSSRQ